MNEIHNRYVASVTAPKMPIYQGWSPCIGWCSANCKGPWLFVSEGVFEFEWDTDYVMFMLRWGA